MKIIQKLVILTFFLLGMNSIATTANIVQAQNKVEVQGKPELLPFVLVMDAGMQATEIEGKNYLVFSQDYKILLSDNLEETSEIANFGGFGVSTNYVVYKNGKKLSGSEMYQFLGKIQYFYEAGFLVQGKDKLIRPVVGKTVSCEETGNGFFIAVDWNKKFREDMKTVGLPGHLLLLGKVVTNKMAQLGETYGLSSDSCTSIISGLFIEIKIDR